MQARDIMTGDPACCTRDQGLREVSRMMVEHHCGAIPVVEGKERKLVGMITDRDIVCRAVAEGKNPLELTAGECMSDAIVAVGPEADLEECCRILEEHQIRRLPVVDESGCCCGVISQADLALHAPGGTTAEVVREVSRKTDGAAGL